MMMYTISYFCTKVHHFRVNILPIRVRASRTLALLPILNLLTPAKFMATAMCMALSSSARLARAAFFTITSLPYSNAFHL